MWTSQAVAPRARAITPVPGGIGPVTDVLVIRNTLIAARNTMPRCPIPAFGQVGSRFHHDIRFRRPQG